MKHFRTNDFLDAIRELARDHSIQYAEGGYFLHINRQYHIQFVHQAAELLNFFKMDTILEYLNIFTCFFKIKQLL